MRCVALISGGKDSCYNMMQCVAAGHNIVALANLQPEHKDELDSYMYQTVGHQGIALYAEAMGLPLYREIIKGNAVEQGRNYKPTADDEVEDLYRLLARIKDEIFIEAVAVGAILSDYQRIRVENVCIRLGLIPLAYLWRRNQKELLQEMITSGVDAIIIKVAALGLDPKVHLGMSLRDIQPHLLLMKEKYGLNVCGEGGEYETFTLDCPLFKKRLVIDEAELVMHTDNPIDPVGYLNLKLHLESKENINTGLPPSVKNSLDFVSDLSDSVFSDLSDVDVSETEVDSIEKLEKEKMKKNDLNPLLNYSGDDVDDAKNLEVHYSQEKYENVEERYSFDDYNESDIKPIEDHRCIYGNESGWYFIGGIVGEGVDTALATQDAINKLISLLDSEDLKLPDVCSVNIYMRDMDSYSILNDVYVNSFNFPNPPARVCVQCPLPNNIGLIFDAVAFKTNKKHIIESDGYNSKERVTMHVQSVSHWAPANIGPYSQAFKVGEIMGTCGQIALVPGTMQMVEGGPRRQCTLALRHLTRVIRGINPRAHIRSVVQSICYSACDTERGVGMGRCVVGAASEARRQLERRTAGALVQFAAVRALPRRAQLEWHAWAHTHNNRFEYEETGCDIGEYKVAITRRWNYENTVAAFVCNIATSSSPSSCTLGFNSSDARARHGRAASGAAPSVLADALGYALAKLLSSREHSDHDHKDHRDLDPVISLRLFYQVWSSPDPSVLVSAVRAASERARCRASVTVVPVLALHNAFTFLSISGLRLDE